MPKKHVVSFKHLIASSSQDFDRAYPTASSSTSTAQVAELLDRSRSANPVRPTRPSLADDVQGELWVPRPVGRLDLELEQGAEELHPAEHLRRAHLAQRQAQRSVAGPAPPRSWRARPRSSTATGTDATKPTAGWTGAPDVTEDDLIDAGRLLTTHQTQEPVRARSERRGVKKLSELCFDAITRDLQSDQPLALDVETGTTTTLGRAMRDGLAYLDPHLKLAFGGYDSCRPTGAQRMGDKAFIALLRPAPAYHDEDPSSPAAAAGEDGYGWDEREDPTTMTLVHHLALTLHPSPQPLLRQLNQLPTIALTSLDLAYCNLPRNADKWISALPVGLRELGLVGVRIGPGAEDKDWNRALTQLGRKLLVLKMLDLSYPTFRVDQTALEALLQPGSRQLPSIRLLGLRGLSRSDNIHQDDDAGRDKSDWSTKRERVNVARRKELLVAVRKDRRHFIEVIWD